MKEKSYKFWVFVGTAIVFLLGAIVYVGFMVLDKIKKNVGSSPLTGNSQLPYDLAKNLENLKNPSSVTLSGNTNGLPILVQNVPLNYFSTQEILITSSDNTIKYKLTPPSGAKAAKLTLNNLTIKHCFNDDFTKSCIESSEFVFLDSATEINLWKYQVLAANVNQSTIYIQYYQ